MNQIPVLPLWFTWALLSAIFASASAVLGKVGLENIEADLATLIRTIVISIFLPLLIIATGKWSNPFALSQQTWVFITLSGVASGLSSFCFFRALKQGDASLVVPVDRLSLLLVALIGFAFLGERPSAASWAALLLIAGGGILLSLAELGKACTERKLNPITASK